MNTVKIVPMTSVSQTSARRVFAVWRGYELAGVYRTKKAAEAAARGIA